MFVKESPALPTHSATAVKRGAVRQGLSLVLPAHNEEPVIRQAVTEAVSALGTLGLDYEVIVVDDGSTDGTRAAALEAARAHPQVRVISLAKNVGYAAALRRGFREARHELVAFTDADCQFDLRELSRLLALTREADVVCGIRRDRQDHWRRKVYSKGFNVLARTMLGTRVQDCDCALKIFRRDWVNSVGLEAEGFFFNAELLARARQQGLSVAEVPVTHRPRQGGQSKVSIGHVLPVLKALITFWWSQVLFFAPGAPESSAAPRSGWKVAGGALLLAVIAALAILPKLSYPLLDPDESRYAQIAKEMVDSGDLLVPTRHGTPYLDKPPLLYWLTAASYRLFGINELAARVVTALAAIGTVLCTYWLGRSLVGLRAAWIGGFLQLMCIGFVLSGRFLYMDSLLTFFTTVSLLAGYSACRGGVFRPALWCLAAAACGLGILTKGPVAPALCLPPLFVSCWLTAAGRPLRVRHWLAYFAIAGGIAAPWFLAVAVRQPHYLQDFLWTHHVQRFVNGLAHEEPIWFYAPILLIAMLPCSILFPAVMSFFTKGEELRRYRTWDVGYLLLFTVWTLGLFSMSTCKLPPYILPVVPAMCLVCGTALAGILAREQGHAFLAYVRDYSPRDLCVILCLGAPVVATIDWFLLNESTATRSGHYAALTVTGLLLVMTLARNLIARGYTRWGVAAVYGLFVLSYGIKDFTPAIAEKRWKVSPIRQFCGKELDKSTPIVCYSLMQEEDAFTFYFHRQQVRAFQWDETADAIAALQQSPQVLLFADDQRLETLVPRLPPTLRLIELGRHENIVVSMTAPSPVAEADDAPDVPRVSRAPSRRPFGPALETASWSTGELLPATGGVWSWPTARN